MNEETVINEKSTKPGSRNSFIKKLLISAALLLAVFLLGLIPMWLAARESAHRLVQTQRELKLSRMHNALASAAIDARRGDYETARQAASDFFTSLREEMERQGDSSFTEAQRQNIKPLFEQRDGIITLLARSDPASADRLSDLYVSYRKAIGS